MSYDEKYLLPQYICIMCCFVVSVISKDARQFMLSIIAGIVAFNIAVALTLIYKQKRAQGAKQ